VDRAEVEDRIERLIGRSDSGRVADTRTPARSASPRRARAGDGGEEPKGIDGLRVEHPPVPAESPSDRNRLERALGEELELGRREDHRLQRPRESVDESISIWLHPLRCVPGALGKLGVGISPVS
jgi:hypothetical protein